MNLLALATTCVDDTCVFVIILVQGKNHTGCSKEDVIPPRRGIWRIPWYLWYLDSTLRAGMSLEGRNESGEGVSEQRLGGGSPEHSGVGRCLRSPSQGPECQAKEIRAQGGAGARLGHGQSPRASERGASRGWRRLAGAQTDTHHGLLLSGSPPLLGAAGGAKSRALS